MACLKTVTVLPRVDIIHIGKSPQVATNCTVVIFVIPHSNAFNKTYVCEMYVESMPKSQNDFRYCTHKIERTAYNANNETKQAR